MTLSRHGYTLTVPAAEDATLTLTGGTVTLDESWSPYIQATLTCAAPPAAVLAALDPRQNPAPRVILTMVQWFLDATPARSFTADLGVRSTRTVDGELTLTLASDEALAQDAALVIDLGATIFVSLTHLVDMFLAFIDAELAPSSDAPLNVVHRLAPGMEIWGTLEPFLQQSGLRLYADENRVWRMVPADASSTDLVRLGVDAVVAGPIEDTIDRDEDLWCDGVVIRYRWRDGAGVEQQADDVATAIYPPTKVKVLEYDAPYPGRGAAQHVLTRAQARGHQLDAPAVNNYLARPGKQFVTPLADGTLQGGHIRSVTWSIDDDRMTITPRDLQTVDPHAWILQPTGTWADAPPGPWIS